MGREGARAVLRVTEDSSSYFVAFRTPIPPPCPCWPLTAVKQDLLLAFQDCVERNGAQWARNRMQVEMLPGAGGHQPGPGLQESSATAGDAATRRGKPAEADASPRPSLGGASARV